MCEFMILAHVWDAFGFLRKTGVTQRGKVEDMDGEDKIKGLFAYMHDELKGMNLSGTT
jgi:hypothetical protein